MLKQYKKIILLLAVLCIIGLALNAQGHRAKEEVSKSQDNRVNADASNFVNRDLVSPDLKHLITNRYGGSASDYYFGLQGGCTDGQYIYYMFIIKNVSTREIVDCAMEKCSVDANGLIVVNNSRIGLKAIGHANNITYNAKTNQFIAVHNGSGTSNQLHLLSADPNQLFANPADDLEVSTVYLKCKVDTINYNPVYDKYIAGLSGNTFDYVILNSDFKIEKSYLCSDKFDTNFGRQGMCSDENYIYFLYSFDSTSGNNYGNKVKVFDWNGKKVCDQDLPEECGYFESQNIVIRNNTIYIGFYTDTRPSKTYYRINQVYKLPNILYNTIRKK